MSSVSSAFKTTPTYTLRNAKLAGSPNDAACLGTPRPAQRLQKKLRMANGQVKRTLRTSISAIQADDDVDKAFDPLQGISEELKMKNTTDSWEEPMTGSLPAPFIRKDAYSGAGMGEVSATSTIEELLVDDVGCAVEIAENRNKAGTHVVCTLGPSSRTVEQISELLAAGMSVARFNFSHGDHEYHSETLANLRQASAETGIMCAVLLDTKGPEVRTGFLETPKVKYEAGTTVTLTADYDVVGNATQLALSYPRLAESLIPGNRILMADGTLMMEVQAVNCEAGTVECEVLNTAEIGERKNCNLPGVIVDLPTITPKDEADILWGIENQVDFLAVSFVRTGGDVRNVRKFMGKKGKYIQVISKVENQQGLAEINNIIRESDGVMLARGDLGMEVPLEKMFQIQKIIIRKCNEAGKPVITATQMLESMCNNPRPTRAEATDVANAVLDGTDSVMLSGETAAGKFPVEAVQIMSSICEEAERCVDNYTLGQALLASALDRNGRVLSSVESLASSAVNTAAATGASCIVVLAATGMTARLIAKYRPRVPVVVGVVPRAGRSAIGFQDREVSGHQVARQLMVTRGIVPYVIEPEMTAGVTDYGEAASISLNASIMYAKQQGLICSGQQVVAMYNVAGENACTVVRVVPCP